MVLIVEFAMVVIMQYDEWVIVENVVDAVMFVELQIGGLAVNVCVCVVYVMHVFMLGCVWEVM